MNKKAKLVLEDGTTLTGISFGHEESKNGEVVFNTGMVGYPETLTDPSYCGQILVLTYPLIGNYGVPGREIENGLLKNFESNKISLQGLIISDYSNEYSHWNAVQSLGDWLKEEKVPALYGIDTRMLTRKLREKGTMPGKIVFDEDVEFDNPNIRNLVADVSIKEPVLHSKGEKKIVLVDCGVKNNIIQAFLRRNISVLEVPYDFDFLSIESDGILISNGPGDPKIVNSTIEKTRTAMQKNIPILGICLGCQILGLASGADTYKLRYGHRSHNQPVNESGTRRCYITSQNHGYAIDSNTLSEDWREWFVNDNDGTNEGIIHIAKPFFGAQFHPEASPGPDDTEFIFDMFVRAIG
ncbi:MAG TPA: glutamine-hydrolyzing carbamoyl-phosphate synthase small subunit [Ignavibacteriaceae bacterium]|nr:glutamine-hydrolyzing carbamoyl-phosphate synthase small subunit [Ignavibacteriaceae bacterium]